MSWNKSDGSKTASSGRWSGPSAGATPGCLGGYFPDDPSLQPPDGATGQTPRTQRPVPTLPEPPVRAGNENQTHSNVCMHRKDRSIQEKFQQKKRGKEQ